MCACGGDQQLHQAASSVSSPILPVRELKALSTEFKLKCMTLPHEGTHKTSQVFLGQIFWKTSAFHSISTDLNSAILKTLQS